MMLMVIMTMTTKLKKAAEKQQRWRNHKKIEENESHICFCFYLLQSNGHFSHIIPHPLD